MTTFKRAAVIPLRAGSKGLPKKNIRMFGGKPLFMHTVDQAIDAGMEAIVISTDIDEVLNADLPELVTVHRRPSHLARDHTRMDSVLLDVLALPILRECTITLLQATSPLRQPRHIIEANELHSEGRFDLVMSITKADQSVLKYGFFTDGEFIPVNRPEFMFSNRQNLPEVWRPNGALYVFSSFWFLQKGTLSTNRIGGFEMNPEFSIDIDTEDDFLRCEKLHYELGGS